MTKKMIHLGSVLLVAVLLAALASPARAVEPCCGIIAINTVVTAKENATGHIITFRIAHFQPVDGAKQSQTFAVGGQVGFQSVGGSALKAGSNMRLTVLGFEPVDGVVSSMSTAGTFAAAPMAAGPIRNKVASGEPCCNITAINAEVTAKETATGRIITFQIAHFQPIDSAKLAQTFKVGGRVGFQPVDGLALKSGSNLRVTVLGFQPVDGVVSSISTAVKI